MQARPPDTSAVSNAPVSAELAAEMALVSSEEPDQQGDLIPAGSALARLPVELDVAIPAREFRVRDLLAMQPGLVVETEWGHGEDLPLNAGEVQVAWSEFEVMDTVLAVRVTRLA